jgi:uncharacterized protein
VIKYKDFSLTELKAEGNEGVITGRASVYGVVDAHNDVVMPGAFTRSLSESANQVVILNQHNTSDPIGMATLADSPEALLITEGLLELELASAREAWIRSKKKLVTGISIGYETLREEYKGSIRQLHEIKLWEVSLVTFPANSFARVTSVKDALSAELDLEFVAWATTEVKAGRMLSAANLTKLKAAMTAMQDAMSAMQSIVAAAEPSDEAASAEVGNELKSLAPLMADIRRTITA